MRTPAAWPASAMMVAGLPSASARSMLRCSMPVSCSGTSELLIEWKSSSQSLRSTQDGSGPRGGVPGCSARTACPRSRRGSCLRPRSARGRSWTGRSGRRRPGCRRPASGCPARTQAGGQRVLSAQAPHSSLPWISALNITRLPGTPESKCHTRGVRIAGALGRQVRTGEQEGTRTGRGGGCGHEDSDEAGDCIGKKAACAAVSRPWPPGVLP